jgi:uncharacterized RDD family membrane protein YckC
MKNHYENQDMSQNPHQVEFQEVTPQKDLPSNGPILKQPQSLNAPGVFQDYHKTLGVNQNPTMPEIQQTIPPKIGETTDAVQMLSEPEKPQMYDSRVQSVDPINQQSSHSPQKIPSAPVTCPNGLELARRDTRFIAALIDGLTFFIPYILLLLVIPSFVDINSLGEMSEEETKLFMKFILWSAGFIILYKLILIAINCVLLYLNGQTIGKRLVSIKIVRFDGSRAGLSRLIFLRGLAFWIFNGIAKGIVGLLNVLFIFQPESRYCLHKRCLHDLVADTTVIEDVRGGSTLRSGIASFFAILILLVVYLITAIAYTVHFLGIITTIFVHLSGEANAFQNTDYSKKVNQAVTSLEILKVSTKENYLRDQKFDVGQGGKILSKSSDLFENITSNPDEFYLQATLAEEKDSPISGKTIRWNYDPNTGTWTCNSGKPNGVSEKYLPKYCQ